MRIKTLIIWIKKQKILFSLFQSLFHLSEIFLGESPVTPPFGYIPFYLSYEAKSFQSLASIYQFKTSLLLIQY